MAIWKESSPAKPTATPASAPSGPSGAASFEPSPIRDIASPASAPNPAPAPSSAPAANASGNDAPLKESLIAAELTIEGKIEGTGHVRIAGKFNGDVNVQGNLTIERGARLSGAVRAQRVIVAGELEGNIESAQNVELLESGALTGDVKAGALTVASGARMRGQVDFGWGDKGGTGGKSGGGKSGDAKPDSDA